MTENNIPNNKVILPRTRTTRTRTTRTRTTRTRTTRRFALEMM